MRKDKARVIVVGGGFGGLYAARALAHLPAQLTVLDRKNHHTFQPLLYQVATAGLPPGDISAPVRWVLRNARNAEVLLANVTSFDLDRREVMAEEMRLPYDFLVVAAGATHAYFGHQDWEQFAPGLKRWAAGVAASPLGRALGVEVDRVGRVLVQPDLSIPGHPEVFVIGDLAGFRRNAARSRPRGHPRRQGGGTKHQA